MSQGKDSFARGQMPIDASLAAGKFSDPVCILFAERCRRHAKSTRLDPLRRSSSVLFEQIGRAEDWIQAAVG
jgi:hypothetical protein